MREASFSRRKFLISASSFITITAIPSFATPVLSLARPHFSSRKLSLYNIHSKEDFEGVYWREGHYDEEALLRLAHLLRDRRNNKQYFVDTRLFDVLHHLHSILGTRDPFHVICGYRSPETNAALHKKNKGVAANSLHVKGKAIDIRHEHISLKNLCHSARSLKAGGVGYYPKSNFIHVDIRPKPIFWT